MIVATAFIVLITLIVPATKVPVWNVVVEIIKSIASSPPWVWVCGIVAVISSFAFFVGLKTVKKDTMENRTTPAAQNATTSAANSPVYQAGRDVILQQAAPVANARRQLEVAQLADRMSKF